MTQRKVPHGIAIALLFILILIVFFFLAGLINSSVQEFTRSIPQYKWRHGISSKTEIADCDFSWSHYGVFWSKRDYELCEPFYY